MAFRYAKKMVNSNRCDIPYEDLAQDVLIRLHHYDQPVEYISSFVYTTCQHMFLNHIRTSHNRQRLIQTAYEYYAYAHDHTTPQEINIDKIMSYFESRPQCQLVFQLMLAHPDTTMVELAAKAGVKYNTFKANYRHVQNHLKAQGVTYHSVMSNN